jgi:HEXXH motif-containing protein
MSIAGEIDSALLPPWRTEVPGNLAADAERRWLCPKGMEWNTYSTESFLRPNVSQTRPENASFDWCDRLENTADLTAQLLRGLRLKPVTLSGPADLEAREMLHRADELLRNVPDVRASVQAFVRAIHVIGSAGLDYDCSFSDPNIPFSIFVSIPAARGRQRELRMMEAVVHECMHLQLSASETLLPIVGPDSGGATWHSPWKKEPRKLQGVLHGMYVFHVLAYVYSALLHRRALSGADETFACARLVGINNELEQVRGVESSPAFTDAGAGLAAAILNRASASPR